MQHAHDKPCICSVVYDLADAFTDHPLASVNVWGPGFVGYDDGLSLPVNIRQRYPCGKLDLIFVFLGGPCSSPWRLTSTLPWSMSCLCSTLTCCTLKPVVFLYHKLSAPQVLFLTSPILI